jgi:chromosomal replication initiation ATPase DnaA
MNIPRFYKSPIDTHLYQQALNWKERDCSLIEQIRECIREVTGADPYMDRNYRGGQFIKSRQLFFYFVRRYAGLTQYKTGKLLDKDHATVVHAEKCVKKYNELEMSYKELFDTIEKKVIGLKIKRYDNNRS